MVIVNSNRRILFSVAAGLATALVSGCSQPEQPVPVSPGSKQLPEGANLGAPAGVPNGVPATNGAAGANTAAGNAAPSGNSVPAKK